MSVIFLGMPRGRLPEFGAMVGFLRASRKHGNVFLHTADSSILTHCFNNIWAMMLGMRSENPFTHFAMIHSDICPQEGWLDVLLEEIADADMISAVVPIKDDRGLTSTALETPGDLWNPRRLTLTEIWHKPETWTEPGLLVNTGLWLCKVGDWCERVCFRQQDKIVKRSDVYVPLTISEDWDFTRQLRNIGLKVCTTRKVKLFHEREEFHTREPWGRWKTDEDHVRYHHGNG